jgi:hypothetical protein
MVHSVLFWYFISVNSPSLIKMLPNELKFDDEFEFVQVKISGDA